MFKQIVLVISKFLQIRGIQPRISKNFLHHYLEQFFLTVGQNNFGNKIPIPVFVRLFNIFLGMLIRREVFSFPQIFLNIFTIHLTKTSSFFYNGWYNLFSASNISGDGGASYDNFSTQNGALNTSGKLVKGSSIYDVRYSA